MALPKLLQSALWSYDLKKMDTNDSIDKRIIIEQVLNYGTWEQLKWVTATYSWKEIEEVAKNPSRGIWMDDALNYWTKILNFKLTKSERENALFRLAPKN